MYFPIEDDEYGTATFAFLICSGNKETFTATRDIAANVRNVVFKTVGALTMHLLIYRCLHSCCCCCLKRNLNAFRLSSHPPARGENVKTFRGDCCF